MRNFAPPAPSSTHYVLFLANKSRTNLLLIIHARAQEIWSSHFFARVVWSEKRQFHNQQPAAAAKPLCVSLPYNLTARVECGFLGQYLQERAAPLSIFQGANSQNWLIGIYLFLGAILFARLIGRRSNEVDELPIYSFGSTPRAINCMDLRANLKQGYVSA